MKGAADSMDQSPQRPLREKASHRRWICGTLALTLLALLLFALPTICIDPLFHYHGPLPGFAYPLDNERYQNDGVLRHFSYDSIITGTSMTENFKTSEAERLFGGTFIKAPYSGGRYKEVNSALCRAYASGHEIRCVIRGLDSHMLITDKDAYREDYSYPSYLYNNNPFDDVQYVFNKTILFNYTLKVLDYTADGNQTTSFDDYANWSTNPAFVYGAESVLAPYEFAQTPPPSVPLTEEEREMIRGNLQQNVIDLALAHPETTFYLFVPPFSIVFWGMQYNEGGVERMLDAEQLRAEMLLEVPNIRLYSFADNFSLVCDLDNYRDYCHYGEWVNAWMLEQMAAGNYLLTRENYRDYFQRLRDFYTQYDYTALNDWK